MRKGNYRFWSVEPSPSRLDGNDEQLLEFWKSSAPTLNFHQALSKCPERIAPGCAWWKDETCRADTAADRSQWHPGSWYDAQDESSRC